MRAVIQRVTRAEVTVGNESVGSCGKGLMILLGVFDGDSESDSDYLAEKISKLRIFEDSGGKMNLSITDIGGESLIVSNFTLCADCRHGNRPDFFGAAKPNVAQLLYERFTAELKNRIRHVMTGKFGADMSVSIINDGPVTVVLDSIKKAVTL